MLIKSQSEVRLYTGHSVHFQPIQFTRPSFSFFFFEGQLVLRLTRVGGQGVSQVNVTVTLFWGRAENLAEIEPKTWSDTLTTKLLGPDSL